MSAPISSALTQMDVAVLAQQQDAKSEVSRADGRRALAESGLPAGVLNLDQMDAADKLGRYVAPRLVNNVLVSAAEFIEHLKWSMRAQRQDMDALLQSDPGNEPGAAALKGKSIQLAGQVMNQTAGAWAQVALMAIKATEIGGVRSKRKGQKSAGPDITYVADNMQINQAAVPVAPSEAAPIVEA
jgi:hypothetical protein